MLLNKTSTKKKYLANIKMMKTKLEQSMSFKKWCYDNLSKKEAEEILARWDYEKNIDRYGNVIKPSEICYSSGGFNRKGYWFKCLKHSTHHSELKDICNFTMGSKGCFKCKQCNSFAQHLIDKHGKNALDLYWDYEKNRDINPWEISKNSSKKVWIKCQEKAYHESYETYCSGFTSGNRCPYCSHKGRNKVHPLDSLGQHIINKFGEDFLHKVWSEKNKKSPFECTPKGVQKVYWKCPKNKHKDYYRKISNSTIFEFRCPKCTREKKESLLQEKVRLYLEDLGYTILHEYNTLKCINPKTKCILPYDNEIKELNLIIEVHGGQHYKETSGQWFDKNFDLHIRKLHDRYKRMYAKSQGYSYLEIPYWTDNEKEEWKYLIDSKIEDLLIIK